MLCAQTLEPRTGAAQSVSGASAEPQDRMLHGIKPGARVGAGREQEGVFSDLYSCCPLVHKQEEVGRARPTSHEAAFHSAEPSFLSLAHFPCFLRAASGQD